MATEAPAAPQREARPLRLVDAAPSRIEDGRRLARALLAGEAPGAAAHAAAVIEADVPAVRAPARMGPLVEALVARHGLIGLVNPAQAVVLVAEGAAPCALADLVGEVPAAVGAPVHAAVTAAVPAGEVPAAVRRAAAVVRLARVTGQPHGLHRVDDFALELALAQQPSAQHQLLTLLAPLEDRPDLLVTLETWLRVDFNYAKTARALGIHRNTVDYRLQRVGELTGLSVATARGLQVLAAAVTVRRLRAALVAP